MKRTILIASVLCMFGVQGGTTYYLNRNASDFSVAAGYTMNEAGTIQATSVPTSEDEVILPAGTVSINAASDSFATLSGVKRVRPGEGAVFEITVAANDEKTFNAPINWNGENVSYDSETASIYGKIVKKGLGTLILASYGNTPSGKDYLTAIDLQAGILKMPQRAHGNMYFGDVTMSDGAILFSCTNLDDPSGGAGTFMRSFSGAGTVTNVATRLSGQMFGTASMNAYNENAFRGKICHAARVWTPGRITHYGHECGMTVVVCVESNYGRLNDGTSRGTYSFEDVALLGSADNVQLYGNGGGVHYFGAVDAEVGKYFSLSTKSYPGFFDAGWHGGLTFTGEWRVAGADDRIVQKWLVLTGSNTVPCTITGKFRESKFNGATDTYRTIFTQKLGSGTWALRENRSHGGGFAIEEGTLQFDSLAEKGTDCALGLSTNLTEMVSVLNPAPVDYAFALGSTNNSAPTAVFEFTGSASCQSTTRPLVLKGKGGSIRASGTAGARLVFGGVSALAAGETTLVLDGTNTNSNIASGIVDGNGKVSVVKDGEGEWYLSGTNTFSGDLHVKAGTLTVLGDKYSWFRFTVKELGSYANLIYVRQLALYDANGVRQNICLKVNPPASSWGSYPTGAYPDGNWQELEPGSFAFGMNFRASNYAAGEYVDQLFSDIGNTASSGIQRADGEISYGKTFKLGIVTSADFKPIYISKSTGVQLPFVMRLTNGAPEIVSYDIESYWNTNQTNNWPKIATMEASVDGIHWDLVETNATGAVVAEHEYDFSIPLGGPNGNNSNKWFSDGTSQVNWNPETGTTPRPGKGFPMRARADIPTPLANVRSVSVAAGATLKTDAGVEIRSLKVDSAGAGTLDGFSFAGNGTIDVVFGNGVPRPVVLSGTYVNCKGLENIAGWGVKFNGSRSYGYRAKVVNGTIAIVPKGMTVSFK